MFTSNILIVNLNVISLCDPKQRSDASMIEGSLVQPLVMVAFVVMLSVYRAKIFNILLFKVFGIEYFAVMTYFHCAPSAEGSEVIEDCGKHSKCYCFNSQ